MTSCRRWLADGATGDVAVAVTDAVLADDVELVAEDLEVLHDLLAAAAGVDTAVLDEVDVMEHVALSSYWFSAEPPDGVDEIDSEVPADRLATVAVAAASTRPEQVLGLWQAWRITPDELSLGAKQVFIVEAAGGDLPELAAMLQDALIGAGQINPQVEVCPVGARVTSYQRAARGYGTLLWASADRPLRRVEVFDEIDPQTGPRFAADHPRLSDPQERARIVGYLRGAQPVLVTTKARDIVTAQPAPTVPLNVRTDGTFIWPEAAGYYLERYELAPDPDLLAAIRAHGYVAPPVDAVTAQRAVAQMMRR